MPYVIYPTPIPLRIAGCSP